MNEHEKAVILLIIFLAVFVGVGYLLGKQQAPIITQPVIEQPSVIEEPEVVYKQEEPAIITLPPEEPKEAIVEIRYNKLYPEKIVIEPGTTVIWINKDTKAHKISATNREFYGPRMQPDDRYEYTFYNTGTYNYNDVIFKYIEGSIEVKAAEGITGGAITQMFEKSPIGAILTIIFTIFSVVVFYIYVYKDGSDI